MSKKNYSLFTFALLSWIISRVSGVGSGIIEKLYYNGFFQLTRSIYDATVGRLPMPMMYVFVLVVIYLLYRLVKGVINSHGLKSKLSYMGTSIFSFICVIVIYFYWAWGFNYNRVSIQETLGIPEVKIDSAQLSALIDETTTILISLRNQIDMKQIVSDVESQGKAYEDKCRAGIKTTLATLGYPNHGRVRIRRLYPKGSLLHFSTAGVYWPFVFEGHIDPGLHPITWPFTMSHEMGHGYGFADEGTCNFLGWLSCTSHEDIFIQYSGWMGYFRYLLSDYRGAFPRSYATLFDRLPQEIQRDLVDISAYSRRYKDIFPQARDAIYDTYLKSHGVKGGLINYSYIIKMAEGWKQLEASKSK